MNITDPDVWITNPPTGPATVADAEAMKTNCATEQLTHVDIQTPAFATEVELGPAPGANFDEIKKAANKKLISDTVDQLYRLRDAEDKIRSTPPAIPSTKHMRGIKQMSERMTHIAPRPFGLLGNLMKNIHKG